MLDDTSPFFEHGGLDYAANTVSGSGAPTNHAALVAGAEWASVFSNTKKAEFVSPVFIQGREEHPFVLEAWVLVIPKTTTAPQKILSHATTYDGLTISGTVVSFATQYLTAGRAEATYDLQINKSAHIVGVHTADTNTLYVNGEMVAQAVITDAQKLDSYVATDGKLYCGESTSNQEIAVNAVAIYSRTQPDTFSLNYDAGKRVVPQAAVGPQFGGQVFNLNGAQNATYLHDEWVDRADFNTGLINNVSIGDTRITPTYVSGLSIAGTWTAGVALDGRGDTDIYGVMVEWAARGVTVQGSLNGGTWTTLENGELVPMVTNHFNPTGDDLEIRFSFAGGLADDPAYVESVAVTGFVNSNVDNAEMRTVTVTYPAVLRGNFEPIDYRDDNGLALNGGTLTIGADTSAAAEVVRTLELWIKPLSGTPTISVTGTKYRNGVADSTLPTGEWSLIHYVNATDITGSVTITGDVIVGQATLYDTALSAANVAHIYHSYTGRPILSFNDASTIGVSEPALPFAIYTHDWSIDGAGG